MPEQLVRGASGPPQSTPPIEGRVFARAACDVSTSCHPTSAWGRKDARWPASISDVSKGGVRLVLGRRFEPGAGLAIELPGDPGDEPSIVLAKVVYVRALPGGSWSLGCKFISELSDDEVQRLLAPAQPAPYPQPPAPAPLSPSRSLQAAAAPPTQQSASRKKVFPGVRLQLEVAPGKVIDCTIQRLAVPGTWPVAAGRTLTLRVDAPDGRRPLLRIEVLRSFLEGGHWTLRCRLVSPAWEELLRALCPPLPKLGG